MSLDEEQRRGGGGGKAPRRLPLAPVATAKDPVCGMDVPVDAPLRMAYRGTTSVFCAQHCLDRFARDPAAFVGTPKPISSARAVATSASTEWTCPMHPEIVRAGAGACPICGMALEPRTASAEGAPNPELVEMSKRFWMASALTAPLVLLAMGDLVFGGAFAA